MAKKRKTMQGLVYYEISHEEQIKLIQAGSFGNRCDSCGETIKNVYWVPVLNWGMCDKCFNHWKEHAKYYEEDEWYTANLVNWIEDEFKKLGIELKDESEEKNEIII